MTRHVTLVLRLAAFLCFAGWSWQHVYWEGPYGVVFWQKRTYDLAASLGIDWESFVGSGGGNGTVQRFVAWMALPYVVCTVLSLTVRPRAWFQMAGLLFGACCLTLLAYATYLSEQSRLPTLIEHGGQVLTPVLLVLALTVGVRHRATVAVAIVATITVFAGHGVYALGLWPTPSVFHGMTTLILGTDHGSTTLVLRAAGALDLVVCAALLHPATRRPAALYAALWGTATALARPVAGMSASLAYFGADHFVHQAVLRAPHALIPLFLFLHWAPAEDPRCNESLSRSPSLAH